MLHRPIAVPAARGYVAERPVPAVLEERVGAQVRDVQVHIAVGVVVTGRDAHPVAGVEAARRVRDIDEAQHAARHQVVPEKTVPRRLRATVGERGAGDRQIRRQHAALHQVDVEVAVRVVVHESRSGPHVFAEIPFAGHPVEVLEVEADVRGHLEEGRIVSGLDGGGRCRTRGERQQQEVSCDPGAGTPCGAGHAGIMRIGGECVQRCAGQRERPETKRPRGGRSHRAADSLGGRQTPVESKPTAGADGPERCAPRRGWCSD